MSIAGFLQSVSALILNPLITLAFAVALLVFFWGVVEFIRSETADAKRADGQKKIVYGLVGMFIMFSAYGIIQLILDTLGIPLPAVYPFS
mgnify:CR=1 FL=1